MKSDTLCVDSYRIGDGRDAVYIERRQQSDGPEKWAVTRHGFCLNRDGEWESEDLPSSRTAAFLARCRFSLEYAIRLARRAHKQQQEEIKRRSRTSCPPSRV